MQAHLKQCVPVDVAPLRYPKEEFTRSSDVIDEAKLRPPKEPGNDDSVAAFNLDTAEVEISDS